MSRLCGKCRKRPAAGKRGIPRCAECRLDRGHRPRRKQRESRPGWGQADLGDGRLGPPRPCQVCNAPVPPGRKVNCSRLCTVRAADRRRKASRAVARTQARVQAQKATRQARRSAPPPSPPAAPAVAPRPPRGSGSSRAAPAPAAPPSAPPAPSAAVGDDADRIAYRTHAGVRRMVARLLCADRREEARAALARAALRVLEAGEPGVELVVAEALEAAGSFGSRAVLEELRQLPPPRGFARLGRGNKTPGGAS